MNKNEPAKCQPAIKNAGIILLLCFVSFMTYKFIAWNSWKISQSISVGKQIINAPSAVNISILLRGKPIFKKSFAPNSKINRYIITGFDITPYVSETEKNTALNGHLNVPLQLRVNEQNPQDIILRRVNQHFIAQIGSIQFFFVPGNYGLEDISSLESSLSLPESNNSKEFKK